MPGRSETLPVVTLPDVQKARRLLADHVHNTPLRHSTTFSRLTGAEVHLKLENLQRTGSFKIRGAMNKMQTLDAEERRRGVIAASAGNHAQGVALAASTLGVQSTIVMPSDASYAKVEATRGYGATVLLHGEDYDAAQAEARRLQQEKGLTFVHAFNDPAIIAGQGTIGLEIHERLPDVDVVVVAVGGGGLISGIGAALKGLDPRIRIVGVEADGAAKAFASRAAGRRVELDRVTTIADGIATRMLGELTFGMVERLVDDLVTVSDAEIARAILMLLERGKTVVEGAGAAPLAALLAGKVDVRGKKVAVLVSGGNIDITLMGTILQRGLMQEGRILRFKTVLRDRPGALKGVIDLIAREKGNLLWVNHDRELPSLRLGETLVDIEVETRGPTHAKRLLDALRASGYVVDVQVGA